MVSLTVEHINKSFAHVQAIKDLSMEVQEGAIFGFLGANGAGKTTTMRMILDILRPDSGSITWNGQDVREVPRRNWGYLPEERGLYPKMRVDEQLLFLAAYIGTALNGTTGTQTAGKPAFALTFSTANALPDLQNQVKNGKLDILLVLARATNQDLRFTYDTSASATNDTNLPNIQALAQRFPSACIALVS